MPGLPARRPRSGAAALNSPETARPSLHRSVGLTGVVMFGAGTAIGVSIFSVLQPASEVAGSALLAAIVIAMIPMAFFAIVYAWLASVLPVSGASYEWPRRFLGPYIGFSIAWLRIISNVGALVVLGQVFGNYVGMVFAVPPGWFAPGLITLVFLLNYVGVEMAARVQTVLMIGLIAVLSVFVVTGVPHYSSALVGNPLAGVPFPALAAVPLLISLFLGIESAVEIGEEVRNPQRTIPLGILLAIMLTALVYGAVALVALGLVGPQALAAAKAPLLEAARVAMGESAVPLIVGAAAISITKTMNSTALVFSRSIFAMARSGSLPGGLAAIHPRFGSPHRAVLLCYGFAMAGLFLPSSLVFLLLAVNLPTMLKYLACSLCAIRIARGEPDLAATARIGLSLRTLTICAWIAVACAIGVILAGLEADMRPYYLVLGWFVVGTVYYVMRNRPGAAL
jgi:APA family basic amino acid/polyamine antiporter